MISRLVLGVTLALCLASSPALAGDEPQGEERVWLSEHNAVRADFGAAPLEWDDELVSEAREWAKQLARENTLRHASAKERRSRGENLWMGTRGAFGPRTMIASFAEEERYFKSGAFPDVSRTGNWVDVGHYTQIIWPETRKVGCAKASNRANDVLVCRYYPAGNVWGQVVGAPRKVARR